MKLYLFSTKITVTSNVSGTIVTNYILDKSLTILLPSMKAWKNAFLIFMQNLKENVVLARLCLIYYNLCNKFFL